MKRNNKINFPVLFLGAGMLFSSCYKSFDPDSYKPPLNIGGYTSSNEIARTNLVGYWGFNGSYIDSISNTSGTGVNTGFTGGVIGQALQGADKGYVLFPATPSILNMSGFTISFWVNSPQNTTGIVGLVNLNHSSNFWGNIDLFLENGSTASTGKFKYHITSNGSDAWSDLYDFNNFWGTWNNITLSYDEGSSTFKLYLNGSKIGTKVQAGYGPLQFTNASTLIFGTVHFQTDPSLTSATGSQPWASYLTGAMDEVRIYDKALTEDEVNALVKLQGRGK